jgi:hypothetical protein
MEGARGCILYLHEFVLISTLIFVGGHCYKKKKKKKKKGGKGN